MAALFCAAEEGNLDGLKDLTEMAKKIDLESSNKVSITPVRRCVKAYVSSENIHR